MELHHANPYHIPPPHEQHHQVTHYQTLGHQTGSVLGGGGSTKSSPAISVNTEFSRDSGFASQDHDFEQRDNQPIYEVTYRHSSSDFSFHSEWFFQSIHCKRFHHPKIYHIQCKTSNNYKIVLQYNKIKTKTTS